MTQIFFKRLAKALVRLDECLGLSRCALNSFCRFGCVPDILTLVRMCTNFNFPLGFNAKFVFVYKRH